MKINPIFYVVAAVLLLGGLFFIFKPQQKVQTPQTTSNSTEQATTPSPTPELKVKTFELVVKGKKLVSGLETITVNEGDEVVIKIASDEPEEFHLHGYDKSVDLEKDTPAELKFTANLTGRFVFELEQSKTDLGAVEVQPKQ